MLAASSPAMTSQQKKDVLLSVYSLMQSVKDERITLESATSVLKVRPILNGLYCNIRLEQSI